MKYLILNLEIIKKINDYHIFEFVGKGGKRGQKRLHPYAISSLESYIQWMKEQDRSHKKDDWLFQPTRNPN